LDETFDWQEIWHKHTNEDARSQPTNALNEVQFMTSIKLLRVFGTGVLSSGSLIEQRNTTR